jgi:DNA-binding HxlR family transcriptional regulator
VEQWQTIDDEACVGAIEVIEAVGKRWNGGILLALARGAERFSDIMAVVRGLSSRLLAVRLRELEHAGLVDRVVVHTMPVSVRYQLTAQGRDLLGALQPIAGYAARWRVAPTHADEALLTDADVATEPR